MAALALALAVVPVPATQTAYADRGAANLVFDYNGAEFNFINASGELFGMYRRDPSAVSTIQYSDGRILIDHVTGNKTIYAGFYLEADISDPSTWSEALFFPRNEGGWLTFDIPSSYAGKAWPIAPRRVSDPTVTTSGQWFMAVPPLDKIPGSAISVTFTDGLGGQLATVSAVAEQPVTPPAEPEREGYLFAGWDRELGGFTSDAVVNATWAKAYTVTFTDGQGDGKEHELASAIVPEGGAVTPPPDPERKDYLFAGWDSELTNITSDLVVNAKWTKEACTVTFTDGQGDGKDHELASVTVALGRDATPPADPEREGYLFAGWDRELTNITEDVAVNATWTKAYTVTFTDGQGDGKEHELGSVVVAEGEGATPPSDPEREGYKFTGWDREFASVTEDVVVNATWLSNDEVTLRAVKGDIEALPKDPKDLLGGDAKGAEAQAVAKACAAYLALADGLKAKLSDEERTHLAECAISVLPTDVFDVTADHGTQAATARSVVDSLPELLQESLDKEQVSSSRTYGRVLENVEWALDSLKPVNNATKLSSGTYTDQVKCESSMGKSPSGRSWFTVKSVTVKDGKATAVLEHSSNASQYLRLGGVQYENLETDPAKKSRYEVPINVNSIFHISVKGKAATDDTDAITYELKVSADESAMKPDKEDGGSGTDTNEGGNGKNDNSGDDKSGESGNNNGNSSSNNTGNNGSNNTGNNGSNNTGNNGNAGTSTSTNTNLNQSVNANPTSTPAQSTQQASTAGNLNSLLRYNSSQNSSSSAQASKSVASASASSASASKESSKASSKATATTGAKNSSKDGSETMHVEELALASSPDASASYGSDVDMAPAVAGGLMLSVALGALGFALRFIRRETAVV